MKKNKLPIWFFAGLVFFAIVGPALIFPYIITYFVIRDIFYKDLEAKLNGETKTIFQKFFGKEGDEIIIKTKDGQNKKINFSFSPKMTPKLIIKTALSVFLFIIITLLIIDGFVSVPAGHTAVIFDKGKGILPSPLAEGLHLKIPFWQEGQIYTTRKQEFTMAGEYSGVKDENAVQGRSSDGQTVWVDVTVIYQIMAKDTPYLRGEFLTEEGYRNTIVRPSARSITYDSIAKYNAIDLVSTKRGEFRDMVFDKLEANYKNNNIILHDVLVRNVTFSQEFSDAIERKQIAEQDIKTAENRKKEAEQIAEKKIIEATAEAKSISLKGEALRENPEMIQLEFVDKMAPQISWGILPDGALPLIDLKSLQQ